MSYQALARKWRPRDFESTIGQDHVVRALTHALRARRLHHAYLFSGTRGVGKTTLARVLAKALNCIGPDGNGDITPEPCNRCDACRAIDAGRFIDYIEMDAASNRGVDEMTQLLERAAYAPSNARFKVYMIDEVHMLTAHAFNAMLKTLEEPPDYVKFILATTDPQKVPVTVLSRCLQFNLKPMTAGAIGGQLARILDAEAIGAEPAALRLLSHAARGSMRDALSLLDQAIAHGAGQVTLESVRSMLGVIDGETLLVLLRQLVARDGAALLATADAMAAANLSFAQALRDLAGLLHRIALLQQVPDAPIADGASGADAGHGADGADREWAGELRSLALQLAPDEVQLYYQIALHGRNDITLAPDEYAGFTMTLMRMLAFQPDAGAGPRPVAARTGAAALQAARPPRAAAALRGSGAPQAATPPLPQLPTRPAGKLTSAPAADVAEVAGAAEAAGAAGADVAMGRGPSAAVLAFDGDWPALVAALKLDGLAGQLAAHSELLSSDAGHFRLRVALKTLLDAGAAERLRICLQKHFGGAVRVSAEFGAALTPTAAVRAGEARGRQQQLAAEAIYADPFVRELVASFGAEVDPGSIRPPQDESGTGPDAVAA